MNGTFNARSNVLDGDENENFDVSQDESQLLNNVVNGMNVSPEERDASTLFN